jgi:hypothetical protein
MVVLARIVIIEGGRIAVANLASHVTALLTVINKTDVAVLTPANRQLLAAECRRVLAIAENAERDVRKAGVFADLLDGRGRE